MYPGTGVYGNTDVRKIYQGSSSTGHPPLWIRYVVSDHRLRTDTGGISQHGGPPDDQNKPCRWPNISWEYPPFGRLWGGAGLKRVEVYITCIQNTVVKYIVTPPSL